jgi:hypothetical protein
MKGVDDKVGCLIFVELTKDKFRSKRVASSIYLGYIRRAHAKVTMVDHPCARHHFPSNL